MTQSSGELKRHGIRDRVPSRTSLAPLGPVKSSRVRIRPKQTKAGQRAKRKLHAVDCANRWRCALKSKPLAQFRISAGFGRAAVFQSLGWCPSVSLAPWSVQYGRRFLKHGRRMGPILAAVSSGGVSSMDTSSMPSPSQSLPFHLQQHVLASQVSLLMMISSRSIS